MTGRALSAEALAIAAALALPRGADADEPWCGHGAWFCPPHHDIALGPSVAYVHGGGTAYNFDIAYSYHIFSASANFKAMTGGPHALVGPELELTGYFLANLGGGVGYWWGDASGPVYHLFAGFPWGDGWLGPGTFKSVFVEPYYRLHFFAPDRVLRIHEAGLYLKVTTYSI